MPLYYEQRFGRYQFSHCQWLKKLCKIIKIFLQPSFLSFYIHTHANVDTTKLYGTVSLTETFKKNSIWLFIVLNATYDFCLTIHDSTFLSRGKRRLGLYKSVVSHSYIQCLKCDLSCTSPYSLPPLYVQRKIPHLGFNCTLQPQCLYLTYKIRGLFATQSQNSRVLAWSCDTESFATISVGITLQNETMLGMQLNAQICERWQLSA